MNPNLSPICSSTVPDSFLYVIITSIHQKVDLRFDCSSFCPITASCNFFLILLLVWILGRFSFFFQSCVGFCYGHRVLSSIYQDLFNICDIQVCALDVSRPSIPLTISSFYVLCFLKLLICLLFFIDILVNMSIHIFIS